MLFMLHCSIEPRHRDENRKRLRDMRIGAPSGTEIIGSWLSVTQLEGWVVFDAPDHAAAANLFHHWTDLNVNHVTPIMEVESLLAAIAD